MRILSNPLKVQSRNVFLITSKLDTPPINVEELTMCGTIVRDTAG